MTASNLDEGDGHEDPVPDSVYSNPVRTNAYAFLLGRIGGRAPAVSRELRPLLGPLVARTLEIAIRSAAFPDHPADLTPWQTAAERAEKATKAIDAALCALTALDPLPWRALRRTRYGGERDPSHDLSQGQADAQADLVAIERARSIFSNLSADAKRRRFVWAAERKNPGDLSRQAFVMTLAEAWLFLTGCAPDGSNDPGKNPFLAFVGAAWADWHGPAANPPSFFSQARTAAEALKSTPSWSPPQWSDLYAWEGCYALISQLADSRSAQRNSTPS